MEECGHYGERRNWRRDGGDTLREKTEVDMLLLPKKNQPEGAQQSEVYEDTDSAPPTKPTTG